MLASLCVFSCVCEWVCVLLNVNVFLQHCEFLLFLLGIFCSCLSVIALSVMCVCCISCPYTSSFVIPSPSISPKHAALTMNLRITFAVNLLSQPRWNSLFSFSCHLFSHRTQYTPMALFIHIPQQHDLTADNGLHLRGWLLRENFQACLHVFPFTLPLYMPLNTLSLQHCSLRNPDLRLIDMSSWDFFPMHRYIHCCIIFCISYIIHCQVRINYGKSSWQSKVWKQLLAMPIVWKVMT